jgi:PHP family Zn ribbon phosphoesterase
VEQVGNEFHILREAEEGPIAAASSPAVSRAIINTRRGLVSITPGYDGQFGRIIPVPA